MKQFEAGQILFAPESMGYVDCPAYVEALLQAIIKQIERVYWNINQRGWSAHGGKSWACWAMGCDWAWQQAYPEMQWNNCAIDLAFGAIEFHAFRYYEGPPSATDPQWFKDRPNFSYKGVAFRWYKRIGRGMNVSHQWSPAEWVVWFDNCLAHVRRLDRDNF